MKYLVVSLLNSLIWMIQLGFFSYLLYNSFTGINDIQICYTVEKPRSSHAKYFYGRGWKKREFYFMHHKGRI